MINYTEIINILKETKSNLNNRKYLDEVDLRDDFNKTISLIWEGLDNLNEQDLTNLYEVQRFLINEVCNIHHKENSSLNEHVLKTNLNIEEAGDKLEDGKRAFNIYSFNDNKWDHYLIGDIHSDTISTQRILERTNFFNRVLQGEKIRLIFLGDYVDRGRAHLKLIQYVLSLKYLFPQNIILQRGNHDGGSFIDGEVKMWVRKPDKAPEEDWFLLYLYNLANSNKTFPIEAIHDYLRFFNSLSYVAFIHNGNMIVMITHGGIPRPKKDKDGSYAYLTSISDLTDENLLDCLDKSIVSNIIWSDPSVSEDDLREDSARFRFTEKQFEEFRDLIGFDVFIRGHQVEKGGYSQIFNKRLITIFSSGKILMSNNDINNETAYDHVNPHIINFNRKGEIIFIDLNAS